MGELRKMKRYLKNKELIDMLKKEPLFRNRLLKDIKEGRVFTAIRDNKIDFYYYKSLLFQYDGEFKTHPKFAYIPKCYGKKYITHGEKIGQVADFYEGYEYIKERAKLYASIEDTGVYNICKKGDFLIRDDYIVLDVEVAFEETEQEEPTGTIEQIEEKFSKNKKNKQNRVDILLYNIREKELLFIEAKHLTNKEIWSKNVPEVVKQVNRYNKEIQQRYQEILQVYKAYVSDINRIFENELRQPLPIPEKIHSSCGLIIFGFDGDQKDGRLKGTKEKIESENIRVYTIGDESKINVKNLYNYIKR